MIYDINTVYCNRCKKFVTVFDSINVDFSSTEIICEECGKILLVTRSERQFRLDTDFEELEAFIHKENSKKSDSYRLPNYIYYADTY
ncbi:MAG: hypothetical protein ACFFDS_08905 [Candidatus Thorarchaeota archaeon]